MSDKPKINFILDIILFILLMAIVAIGLLMKYSLLSGKDQILKYGKTVHLELFGLDRHDWGTIHFIVALIFLAVFTFHIVLHWRIIVTQFKHLIEKPFIRILVLLLFITVNASLLLLVFVIEPQLSKRTYGQHQYGKKQNEKQEFFENSFETVNPNSSIEKEIEITQPASNAKNYYDRTCLACHPQPKKLKYVNYQNFNMLFKGSHHGITLEEDKIKSLYNYIQSN